MRFVLLDRLLEIVPGAHASASMTFSPALPVFADHFPGRPIVPGVLLTESMCQAGGWLIAATAGFGEWPLLARIDRATFRRPVAPGEPLIVTAALGARGGRSYEIRARVSAGGVEVASARLLFHATPVAEADDATREAFVEWSRGTFAGLGGHQALGTHEPV